MVDVFIRLLTNVQVLRFPYLQLKSFNLHIIQNLILEFWKVCKLKHKTRYTEVFF